MTAHLTITVTPFLGRPVTYILTDTGPPEDRLDRLAPVVAELLADAILTTGEALPHPRTSPGAGNGGRHRTSSRAAHPVTRHRVGDGALLHILHNEDEQPAIG